MEADIEADSVKEDVWPRFPIGWRAESWSTDQWL